MKSLKLFLVWTLMSASLGLGAQSANSELSSPSIEDSGFKIGVTGGPGVSNFEIQNPSGPTFLERKLVYSIGFNAELELTKLFSLKSGIGLAKKGNKSSILVDDFPPYEPEDLVALMHNYYINIPLLLRAGFGNQKAKCYVGLGGYGAFLTRSVLVERPLFNFPERKYPRTDHFKFHDIGILAELSGEFQLNERLSWNISIRHNQGLTDISEPVMPFDETEVRNKSTELLLGLNMKLRSCRES